MSNKNVGIDNNADEIIGAILHSTFISQDDHRLQVKNQAIDLHKKSQRTGTMVIEILEKLFPEIPYKVVTEQADIIIDGIRSIMSNAETLAIMCGMGWKYNGAGE